MTDALARRMAVELRRRGLAEPARLLADAHRPVAPLLADLGAAIGPLVGGVIGSRPQGAYDDESLLDALIDELGPAEDAR